MLPPDREKARLDRTFDRLERQTPGVASKTLAFLRQPYMMLIRIPLGLLLVLGGVLSFLPVLGIWMLPLGLLLLAIDLPPLRRPVNRIMLWAERKWLAWRRRRTASRDV